MIFILWQKVHPLFEVPYFDSALEREIAVVFNTWGHDWQASDGPQGPEPYTGEYMDGTRLPESLAATGFSYVEQIDYTFFDSLFIATK